MGASGNITITTGEFVPVHRRSAEFVERKGVGHPDTMADLLADTFSFRYSSECLRRFGSVPNHWVDKVNLAGAAARVGFGDYAIDRPIHALLLGKVTERVGGVELPVADLFAAAARDVLVASTRDEEIADHLRTSVLTVTSRTPDHHPGFYEPASAADLGAILAEESVANDSVICAAGAGESPLEGFVLRLERYLQSPELTAAVPGVGTDIKVLAARIGDRCDLTVCVPFHPRSVDSWDAYAGRVELVRAVLRRYLREEEPVAGVTITELFVNSRDRRGRGYLAPFGTALGKGDCGVVGRGNRGNGLISALRASGVEAPAGKNPIHHTGRLYTLVAHAIATEIHALSGVENETVVTSRIGDPLDRPAAVCVNLATPAPDAMVAQVVTGQIARLPQIVQRLLTEDPVAQLAAVKAG